MAFPQGIDGKAVYLCTGNPLPEDIQGILQHCLNDSFKDAFETVKTLCYTNGYALSDVLREVSQPTWRSFSKPAHPAFASLSSRPLHHQHHTQTQTPMKCSSFPLLRWFHEFQPPILPRSLR